MIRFLPLLLLLGCGSSKATMSGVADKTVYFDGWVPVKVHNAPEAKTWVRLNKKQLAQLEDGSRIVFEVRVVKVQTVGSRPWDDIVKWAIENRPGGEQDESR